MINGAHPIYTLIFLVRLVSTLLKRNFGGQLLLVRLHLEKALLFVPLLLLYQFCVNIFAFYIDLLAFLTWLIFLYFHHLVACSFDYLFFVILSVLFVFRVMWSLNNLLLTVLFQLLARFFSLTLLRRVVLYIALSITWPTHFEDAKRFLFLKRHVDAILVTIVIDNAWAASYFTTRRQLVFDQILLVVVLISPCILTCPSYSLHLLSIQTGGSEARIKIVFLLVEAVGFAAGPKHASQSVVVGAVARILTCLRYRILITHNPCSSSLIRFKINK